MYFFSTPRDLSNSLAIPWTVLMDFTGSRSIGTAKAAKAIKIVARRAHFFSDSRLGVRVLGRTPEDL